MKRDELEKLGLSAEQIDSVMKIHGEDINREKTKYADYEDIKNRLTKAEATIDGMKDYEEVKSKVSQYQTEAENARKEAEQKVKKLELQARIKDFTNGKKFVNELTRDAINSQLESALEDDTNKGKSMEDLLKSITEGKADIFKDENAPTPPTVAGMGNEGAKESGVMAAFKALNPNLNLD